MKRQNLTNGMGWFDTDKAIQFREATDWDGRNQISRATGSQWDHELLYYTASGNWILHHWSQWQGSMPSFARIDQEEAILWLMQMGVTDLDELPEDLQREIETRLDAFEV